MTSWGPPRPASPSLVARDTSCLGVLGATLQRALADLQSKPIALGPRGDGEREGEDEEGGKTICLDEDAISSILTSAGQAVARGQQDAWAQAGTAGAAASGSRWQERQAPAVLVQGRIESYNRYGGKWRMVLKDAKFRLRKPLPRIRPKTPGERQSLWSYAAGPAVASSDNGNQRQPARKETDDQDGDLLQCEKLEILAYNDVVE